MAKMFDGQAPGQFYANLFRSYIERRNDDRRREERNWGMFSGVNFKQWDPKALEQLIDEKRPPHQINFVQNKVLSMLGTLLQSPLDTIYETENGVPNDGAILMNTLLTMDRERGRWKKAKRLFMLAGLVFRGVCEIYKDSSVDPLGTISLRYHNGSKVVFDPDWETDNINDNEHILFPAWLRASQIFEIYDKKTPEIREAIKDYNNAVTARAEEINRERVTDRTPEMADSINHRFLVIQGTSLQTVSGDRLLDTATEEFLPEMGEDNMRAMIALRGSQLKVVRDKWQIVKVKTTVPGLNHDLVLEDGNHPTQIGRYPLFTWSALNIHGEPQGMVDVLKDLQEIYNKRESTFTHWQTTAPSPNEFVEEDFFADGEYNRYKREKNVPGAAPFKTQANKISQQKPGIMPRNREAPPNDLHVSADRAFNMSSEVTPITPPVQGGQGKSGESEDLFTAKVERALVAMEPMKESLMDVERDIGEAYMLLAKQVYSGSPRILQNKKNKEPLLLNVPTSQGVVNNVASIPRLGVIVTQSKSGETVKRQLLSKYNSLLERVQNPILRSFYERQLVSVLPNIPDSEIQEAIQKAQKFEDLQEARVDMELAKIRQTLGKMGNQMQPQAGTLPPEETPEEGGGLSVEGASIDPQGGVPVDVNNVNQLR